MDAATAPNTLVPVRDEHGHYKPGESGNLRGRPPADGPGLQHWLDTVARRSVGEPRQTYMERAAVMLWSKAAAGEIEAIRYVFDRVLGKPMQSVALSGNVDPLMFVLVPPGTQPAIEAQGTEAEDCDLCGSADHVRGCPRAS